MTRNRGTLSSNAAHSIQELDVHATNTIYRKNTRQRAKAADTPDYH